MNKTETRSSHNSQKSSAEDLKFRELSFELADVGSSKIVIAIGESGTQKEINRRLASSLRLTGVRFKTVQAERLPARKLLAYLIESAGSGGSVAITDIASLKPPKRLAFLASLNFHRDAILRLPIGLLLWVDNDLMYQLAASAPDLWSRRTAVLDFSDRSAQTLIRKLFESSPIPRESWTGKDSLSECLEHVLSKEAQLVKCKTIASVVDISRAKEAQVALLEASKKLLATAESDRKIELSLWLWNLARVDALLQGWLGRMDSFDRRAFEHMYLDRNEILLRLAEKMPDILRKYQQRLQRELGTQNSVSLLALYMEHADGELNKITQQLVELNYQNDVGRIFEEGETSSGSIFTEMAAIELQSWLDGESKKRPRYLNLMEGDVLQALYSGKPLLEEANQFGATQEQMFDFIETLETKVRMILGKSSKIRASNSPG